MGRESIFIYSSGARIAESLLPPSYRHGHADLSPQFGTTNLATKAVIPTRSSVWLPVAPRPEAKLFIGR